jgi:fumarate hydratase class II
MEKNISVRDVILDSGLVTKEDLDALIAVDKLTETGYAIN